MPKPAFDPNKPFEAEKKPSFDPKGYYESVDEPKQEGLMSMRGLAKGALSVLPVAGGVGGGILGSAAGGIGAVPGAMFGAAGGAALQQLGEKYLEPGDTKMGMPTAKGLVQSLKYPAEQAAMAGSGEIGAQGLGKLGSVAANSRIGVAAKEGLLKAGAKTADSVKGLLETAGNPITRAGVGGYVGREAANELGLDPKAGMLAGAALSNPTVLAAIIKGARSGNAQAIKLLAQPQVQSAISQSTARGLLGAKGEE